MAILGKDWMRREFKKKILLSPEGSGRERKGKDLSCVLFTWVAVHGFMLECLHTDRAALCLGNNIDRR
jgi:hypothetical protein